jgi:hypothetical protein
MKENLLAWIQTHVQKDSSAYLYISQISPLYYDKHLTLTLNLGPHHITTISTQPVEGNINEKKGVKIP